MDLAIDIGGTKTLLAVFDAQGQVVFEHKIVTPKKYEQFLKDIEAALANELKTYDFNYCCCAAPGLINQETGVVRQFGNLDWKDVPLKADLRKILPHAQVLIQNDVKLAGLSEAKLVQNKYKKVLYITVSTGISAGYIINGYIDPSLVDSEPGHMMLEHNGQIQEWEDFASGRALKAQYGKLASEIDDPEIWQEYSQNLALGIQQLLAVIQPDVVVLGGSVGTYFEKYAAPLSARLKQLENNMVPIPPVIKAQRPEEAVIYGCYELIRQQG